VGIRINQRMNHYTWKEKLKLKVYFNRTGARRKKGKNREGKKGLTETRF